MLQIYEKIAEKIAHKRVFLTFLSLILIQTFALAQNDSKITIQQKNITVIDALKTVEKQSKMSINYSDSELTGKVIAQLNLQNASLETALDTILKGTGFSFQIQGNYIIIAEKKPVVAQILKNIKGKVTDESGEPLIGVNISVDGSSTGTITDFDGNFTIKAAEKSILKVSYIGYAAQIIPVSKKDFYPVVMKQDTEVLDEVVVTALGIKRAEKALSYNVQQVKGDALTTVKDANFVNSLNGKIAGVSINKSASGVGGATRVVMRGAKSIEGDNNALYVVDGIPLFNTNMGNTDSGIMGEGKAGTEGIADFNPEDIESLSVLSGPSAAALYGSSAANGVILITTKKGKEGRLQLTVSQNTEFLRPFRMPEFQNRYGTGDLLSNTSSVEKSWGHKLNSSNYMGYSPVDDFLQTGVVTTETVALSTGTERNQTYFSASAINSDGMVPNNDYNRYNFTFRNTTSFLKDKMTLDVSANYVKQNDRNMVNQGTYSNPLVTAYLFPRGDDWNDIKMYERYDTTRKIYTQYWPQDFSGLTGQNPYWIAYRNLRETDKDRYMLSAALNYKILDWLSVSGRVRVDNSDSRYTRKLYATSNEILVENSKNGLYGISQTNDKQTYADFMVNINKTFKEVLSLQANLGASYSDMQQDVFSNEGPISDTKGIANVFNVFHLDNDKTKRSQSGYREQTQSIFASVELGYKSTYYLTLTGRTDWPSQLAGPNSVKSAFFYPSIGGSVILSELLPMPKQISFLKLRASYASVGLPFPRFLANPTYEWDQKAQKWAVKTHYPMYELKPEKTNSWEIGITARFLDHFNFDLGLYTTKTYNQTFEPNISVSSQYSTIYVQTGSVRNKGIELSLGYDNDWNGKFRWGSTVTFSANKNEILELMENYKHPETGAIITLDRLEVGGLGDAKFVLKKGGSLGDLYSIKDLQRDSNGNIYVNEKGEVASVASEDIKLGSVFPKCNLSWRNDFKWKNLNFGFMLSARFGGIVYSATQSYLDYYGVSEASAAARDFGGVTVNGSDVINAQKWYSVVGAQNGIPQYYTYSATNVRLQEASIGYTIPKNKLWGIADITVSLVGRNLWMLYCKAPFDPEAVATTGNYYQGIDNFMTPSARSLGFNVRFKF